MSKDMGNTPDKNASTSGVTDKAKAKDHSSKQDKEAANKDKVLAERDKEKRGMLALIHLIL